MLVKDLTTGQTRRWSMTEILHEINRDHSDNFTPYNADDWRDGWAEEVEPHGYFTLKEDLPHE